MGNQATAASSALVRQGKHACMSSVSDDLRVTHSLPVQVHGTGVSVVSRMLALE